MKRLQYVAASFLLFLSFDIFARVSDKIEELATENAHKAAQDLKEMGEVVIPDLKKALWHQNLQVRQFATALLCELDVKTCQVDLREKIDAPISQVELSEKFFYASFMYSLNMPEARGFLLLEAKDNYNVSALQILVDAYDRENQDVFIAILKELATKNRDVIREKFDKQVHLCVRGIATSGDESVKDSMRDLLTGRGLSDYLN